MVWSHKAEYGKVPQYYRSRCSGERALKERVVIQSWYNAIIQPYVKSLESSGFLVIQAKDPDFEQNSSVTPSEDLMAKVKENYPSVVVYDPITRFIETLSEVENVSGVADPTVEFARKVKKLGTDVIVLSSFSGLCIESEMRQIHGSENVLVFNEAGPEDLTQRVRELTTN